MKNENFILKIYSISLTLILGFILLSSFISNGSKQEFDEITVERINIVEPDGKLKMVISNQKRQHPGMIDGVIYPDRKRPPGILFFNEEQDEIGGLSYYGNKAEGGNQIFLSFDQYKDDQIMQLMEYTKGDGDNRYGLQLWEREKTLKMQERTAIMDSLENAGYNYRQKLAYLKTKNGGEPVLAPRMFVGKNYNRETGVFLQDKNGVDRMRFYIDAYNTPKIEILDENGEISRNILSN